MDTLLVQADVNDERRAQGSLQVIYFSKLDKSIHAIKKLALMWALATISILIPVFHFILVPLFLVLGLYTAYRGYNCSGRVITGQTSCPHCRNQINIKSTELKWPLTSICQKCANTIRIRKHQ